MNSTSAAMGFVPADPAPKTTTAAAPTARKNGSMGKIFVLVGVAILVFLLFTAYSVQKEIEGSAQLAAIKDLYFPVLQRLDADIVRVDKMEERYIEVVVTGDRDSLEKASDLSKQADAALAEIEKLYPAGLAGVQGLRKDLKNYEALAGKAATAFLSQDSNAPSLTTGMNDALAAVRKDLHAFRDATYKSFADTLAASEHDAQVRLLMGLALGVMNLCFMAVLVYFIRNNMKMMDVIAVQNATLEQRVAERTAQLSQKTADINAMLNNMKLGVSTVIPGNRIHPEYSNYLTTIFSVDNLAGKDLIESLFASSNLGLDVKDQISASLAAILGEEAMMFDFNGHLLPGEMTITEDSGKQKIIQMDWSPIVSEQGVVEKVLLITQDVTHLRALEASSAQQKRELDIISNIIRVPAGKFNDFVDSAEKFIAANEQLIKSAAQPDAETIAALFRNMHTIKGNARTLQFVHTTDVAHRAEQTYDRLRKDPAAVWNTEEMLAELESVRGAIADYVKVNEEKLGRKGRAADLMTARGVFVSNEQLAEVRSLASAARASRNDADVARLQEAAERLGLITLTRLVSGAVDSLSSVAAELKKPVPSVDVVNGEVGFNSQFAEALKSSFMHIVRNALDHGIESPADRARAHKPEAGTVRFVCDKQAGRVELRIADDGRGLALHKLYEKGVAAGVFAAGERPARQAIAELIFLSGLSTSEQVTQVSGRGVGMDAARNFLKEQGATLRIELKGPETQLEFAPFEFVLEIPMAACSYRAAA